MGRILGIDVGDRRTGVAVSDVAGVACRPLVVIEETDRRALGDKVLRLAAEHEATTVVVGIPRPLGGGDGPQAARSREVVTLLQRVSSIPVVAWDERFTTKLAKKLKPGAGHADAVAAAFMLQNFLDAQAGRS